MKIVRGVRLIPDFKKCRNLPFDPVPFNSKQWLFAGGKRRRSDKTSVFPFQTLVPSISHLIIPRAHTFF